MSLIKELLNLKKKKISFFTTPSHGQKEPFKTQLGKKYYNIDMSEVDGLDNLSNPEGCIKDMICKLSEIYASGLTYPLTNGSSQGVLAVMLALLNKNDKVLIAENCHSSVHNGLILSGAMPVWIKPNFDKKYGIYTTVTPQSIEDAITANKDAKMLIITSPTYDGIISNVEKISAICKANNVILFVDEAHGALWNFDKSIEVPAILLGADIAVQSLHKTCGAINPASLLHISKNTEVEADKIISMLNMLTTTSPSYPLLVNIEEITAMLHSQKGKKLIDEMLSSITIFTNELKKLEFIDIYDHNNDITKILIHTKNIPAEEACDIIYNKYKIECEIQHESALTFICGVGTTKTKLKKLLKALKYINKISLKRDEITKNQPTPPIKKMAISPQNAYYSEHIELPIKDALGKICAQTITTYPPGIPLLTLGEVVLEEHLKFIDNDLKIRIVK